jgi:hypothetical protein
MRQKTGDLQVVVQFANLETSGFANLAAFLCDLCGKSL